MQRLYEVVNRYIKINKTKAYVIFFRPITIHNSFLIPAGIH
jgi:hypothetical protein